MNTAAGRQVFVAAFGEVARDAVREVVHLLLKPGAPELPPEALYVRDFETSTCRIRLLVYGHPSRRAKHPYN